METDERLVYPENGRTPEYTKQLEEINEAGNCPFCPENLKQYKKEPIIREGTYWLVTAVDFPYEGAKGHYMFIAKEHLTDKRQLRRHAQLELFEHIFWLEETYGLKNHTLIFRSGGPDTGATVAHLHAQLVSAKSNLEKPIITRIG